MKTYLYNRVSSGKQSKKDGLTRQAESEDVLEFIKKHKLQVVKTLEYVGSSFYGKNFDRETVLGKFIEEVKSGKIVTPVCLCFENWDRFGRDVEWKNAKRFLDLIDVDVSIGVVSMDIIIDQKSLAKNPDILQLVGTDIQRARKESQRKSGFAKRNLAVKVADAKKGHKVYFGGQSPRWIMGVKSNQFVKNEPMVADIERIFKLYLSGKSCVGVAKILNAERKGTFGSSTKNPNLNKSRSHWFNTSVRNVLTNKSLTGWCKVNDFESEKFYPEIIKPFVFLKVQKLVAHNATRRGGSKIGNVPNIFSGLIYCKCGGKISARYSRMKGRDYHYMACRRSQVDACREKTIWKMNELEETIFAFILEKTPDELLAKPKANSNNLAIAKFQVELKNTDDAIKKVVDMIGRVTDMPELESRLIELREKKKTLKGKITHEQSKRFVGEANPMAVAKFKDLMKGSDGEALGAAANSIHTKLLDKKTRQNLSIILPDIIKRITCDLKKWEFDVEFTNGTNKHCFFYE